MTGLLTALLFGVALTLPAAGLAWTIGLLLQARTRHSSPALWRSARLVAILPLVLAPALFAVPQTLPPLPALEFIDQPAPDMLRAIPMQDVLATAPAALPLPSLQVGLATIYLLGLIAALSLALLRHSHRRRLLRGSRLADRHERAMLDGEAEKLGLAAPELRLCAVAASPFLTGWRGVIIAPEALLRVPEMARHALVHELCHLRRGDERDRLVGSALTIMLWFNWPLRQIERELDAAREIACDTDAIEALGRAQRKAYAATLIETMRSTAQPVSAFGPHNRRHREMRIKSILTGGQTVRHSLLTAGALLLLAIPVACAQTAVTPRRVVSAPVDQIAPQAEARGINQARSAAFMAAMELQDGEDWNAVIQTLEPVITDVGSSAHDRSVALQLRGRAYYELDRIDDAIADWQAAILTGAMEPGEVESYRINIAQLMTVSGRYDDAITAFDEALAGDEAVTPQLNRMLAQLYVQAERLDEGMAYAEAAYQAEPDAQHNQHLMLLYYQQLGLNEQMRALQARIDAAPAPLAPTPKRNPRPAATPRNPSPVPAAASAPAATPHPVAAPNLPGPIMRGRVSSHYGPRPAQPAGAPVFHGGTDIAAPSGTAISAPGRGTVIHAEMGYKGSDRWGNTVEIDHGDGWSTVYAHLDAIGVVTGQAVSAGQQIGTVGATGVATGPHLHVELHHEGQRVDPANHLAGLD